MPRNIRIHFKRLYFIYRVLDRVELLLMPSSETNAYPFVEGNVIHLHIYLLWAAVYFVLVPWIWSSESSENHRPSIVVFVFWNRHVSRDAKSGE